MSIRNFELVYSKIQKKRRIETLFAYKKRSYEQKRASVLYITMQIFHF